MSYINYTTYTDAIGEWTLRRERPDFEDFPGYVPPFGVEASPPPPTPPTPAAAPMTPRKPRSALAALSSNLLSPSPSKKKNPPSSFSFSSSPVAAPGIGVEQTFAGVWGNFVPFKEMNDREWEEEKKNGTRAVLAEIAARKEEGIREYKRKNNERERARYAAKKAAKAAKKKAKEEKEEREEEEEEEREGQGKGKKAKIVKGKGEGKNI